MRRSPGTAPRRHRGLPIRWALLACAALGCDPIDVGPIPNPVPVVIASDPAEVAGGVGAIEVRLTGLGFVEGAEAVWNGEPRATTYGDATFLTVTLSAADVAVAGTGRLIVVNPPPGGGESQPLDFVVGSPRPLLVSLSPSAAPAVLTTDLVLRATGSGFAVTTPSAQVLWDGTPLQTTVASASELIAAVPDYLLRSGRFAEVAIRNPRPGGGMSNALAFGVENPQPVVTRVQPLGVTANADSNVQVDGSGFVSRATVLIDGTRLVPLSVSGNRIAVRIPAALAGIDDTLTLSIENPAPGGGVSGSVRLPVWTLPPRIDNIFPTRAYQGSPALTVVIAGEHLDPAAEVTWNGSARATTYVDSRRIDVALPASDLAVEGTFEIRVTNPGGGGSVSVDFVVLPAFPSTRVVMERWGSSEVVVSEVDGSDATSFAFGTMARVDAAPAGPGFVYHDDQWVYEVNAATGARRRVTTAGAHPSLGKEEWARYSPDGTWIYFTGHTGGTQQIWRARADGTAAGPLVVSSAPVGFASAAHDDRRLVYSRLDFHVGGPLFVYDMLTEAATPLDVDGLTSRWSPADDWVVYLTRDWDLRAVRPDGTGDFQVTFNVDVGHGFDFSPDGHYIVGTTQVGEAILISFPSGTIEYLPDLGVIGSIAMFGP